MEKKKFLRMVLPFIAGAAVGFGVWALYSFTQSQSIVPGVGKITVADAHTYAQNYYNAATVPTEKIKGFTIDKGGLSAMNSILAATPTAAGFRIYFGTNASGAGLWIMCGMDPSGADMTANIYSSQSGTVGLCPKICDINSPVPAQ
jgi:hypothetical protein